MHNRLTIIRRPLLAASVALMVGWLGFAGTAWGQISRDDVRAKLEQTDRLIERARDVVAHVGGPRAQQTIETAQRQQRQAWDAFNRGRLSMADHLTEMARQNLLDLMSTFRQSEDNVNEVERQLDHTDRALQDIRDQLGPNPGPSQLRRLEAAIGMQQRAWDLFRQQHLRPALKMTLQAREMAAKLAGGGPGHGPGRGPAIGDETGIAFEPRYDRLREAAERVGERVEASDNDAAREIWNRAQRTLEEARTANEAGDSRRADQLLRRGRELLERAMRQVQREVRGDQVELLIASASERLDLLASPVQESGEQRLKDWHEQARRDLEGAQTALAGGHVKEALVQTRKAVSLLDKIADELGL